MIYELKLLKFWNIWVSDDNFSGQKSHSLQGRICEYAIEINNIQYSYLYFLQLKEGFKNKIVECYTKVWGGGSAPDFSLRKKNKIKNILPIDHFETLIFLNFWVGNPSQLGSWSKGCVTHIKICREAIWQVSEDPYHTQFVSLRGDNFLFFWFFSTKGLFINYVIFFWTIPDPYPPPFVISCHLLTYPHLPPYQMT